MKVFPHHPTTVEIYSTDGRVGLEILPAFKWEPVSGERYPILAHRDYGDHWRQFGIMEVLDESGDRFEAVAYGGFRIVARRYDDYDAVRAGMTSYPLPEPVMESILNGEGTVSLEALVDENGDVATMLMTTPVGFFARYDAQWIILTDLELISHLDAVAVEDTALDLYDPYDQTGASVKIGSMPLKPSEEFRVAVNYSPLREAGS
jgi:hypothetical protein